MSFIINPYWFASASSFSPSDIAGLYAWYDAAPGGSSKSYNGSNIVIVTDLSGNGLDLGPSVGDPLRGPIDGTINGIAAMDFNGTSSSLEDNSVPFTSIQGTDQDWTVFTVFETDTVAATQDVISLNAVGTPYITPLRLNTTPVIQTTKRDDSGATVTVTGNAYAASTPYYSTTVHTGTATTLRLNGVEGLTAGSQDVGQTSVSRLTIGSWHQSTSFFNYMDGRIGEVIIYDSALSSGDVEDVEAYLAAKWGI